MLRLLLYGILAFILWRMFRVATRMMQSSRSHDAEDPFATAPPPKKAAPLEDIRDADFEDITDQPPPKSPPPKP